jgi:uridine kinase
MSRTESSIVGISGGTGSGKTTAARRIIAAAGVENVVLLQQDSYYRDLIAMPLDQRRCANFDHPDALDNELLLNHVRMLRSGRPVERPVYDFAAHVRKPERVRLQPAPVIIVEGILVFCDERMRRLMDLKIFVDCDPDIRFIRRLERDLRERGRSVESVIGQYLATVRPMHLQFVEPSKRYADIILPEGGLNDAGIDLIKGKIRSLLSIG